jgi:hypothetical protein
MKEEGRHFEKYAKKNCQLRKTSLGCKLTKNNQSWPDIKINIYKKV